MGRYVAAIKSLGFDGAGRALDIGCGVGQWTAALAGFNAHVTGVDVRPEYVALAKQVTERLGLGDRLAFRTGEAERLEEESASIDAVLSHMVMMWVAEPELGIGEIARVLKPGGRAYIAYTTDAMLLRRIAAAQIVGWEGARIPAANLVSNAAYDLGVYRLLGSRVRSFAPGQLERLAAMFGLDVDGVPHVEDEPHDWKGHAASGDFLASKATGEDMLTRVNGDRESISALREFVAAGAPRLAARILDRLEAPEGPHHDAIWVSAQLKMGRLDAAAPLLDSVPAEEADRLRGIYLLQHGDPTGAAAALKRSPSSPDRDFLLACAQFAAGEPALAGALFERELERRPGSARAVGGAVLAALDLGDPRRAAEVIAAVPPAETPDRPRHGTVRGAALTAVARIDEAAETSEPMSLESVGLGAAGRMPYQVTNRALVPLVFEDLEIGAEDVFVDFGCGKGRMLLAAAMHPFKRIVGVDISPELCAVATENVERNRDRLRCQDIDVVVADVTRFDVPDDLTVAYLYNPFKGAVFKAFLDRLTASIDRRPRTVRLIYLLPVMDQAVRETERFDVVERRRFGEGELQEVVFYRSRSPNEQRGTATSEGAGGEQIPIHEMVIEGDELTRVDPAARALFRRVAGRLGSNEFFGRDEPPAKEWAYIDLDDYPDFDAFVRACRKVHGGNAVRDARKAGERGYAAHFFEPTTFVGDITDIDTSAYERQGVPMAAHYQRTVEERGGFPQEYHPETRPRQAFAWDRHFGLFAPAPGHRQGNVVVDERLLSYIKLRRLGPFSFYGTILGHADRLREGIMYKLHLDLIEYILNNRRSLAEGDPDADHSLEGLRFIGYANFFHLSDGLAMWKRRMLFRPGYFLLRYPDEA